MTNKTCDICGKKEGVNQLILVMYDVKNNESEKGETKIIGAVSSCVCKSCLIKIAWKKILFSILGFLASVVGVSLLAGLLDDVLNLIWIGGSFIVFGLFINMIKKIIVVPRETVRYGAASYLEQKYKKQGHIPKQDFLWIGENKETLFDNDKLNLNGSIGEISLFTYDAVEETLKIAPDNEEIAAFRCELEKCKQIAIESKLLQSEINIRKEMWFPVVVALLAMTGLFTGVLLIIEGVEMSSTPLLAVSIAVAILSVCGAFFFAKKKAAFGYIAFAAVLAAMWIGVMAFTDGDSIYFEDAAILSIILLAPCLLYLPFVPKKK